MKYQVKSIDYQDCKEWFLKKHYAKRMPSVSFCFGLYSDKLEGVCSYGKPASPNLCESICGAEHKEMVYELNRLVVNDGLAKNTLSYFVSQTLKLLSILRSPTKAFTARKSFPVVDFILLDEPIENHVTPSKEPIIDP